MPRAVATLDRSRCTAVFAALVLAFCIQGCGGSALLRSYNDPSADGNLLEPIAVLAFHPNPEIRKQFENDFAAYLRERGNDVVEAYTLSTGNLDPTRDALKEVVQANGLAGVFTVRVLASDPNQEGNPDKTAYRPDREGDLYQYFFETRRDMLPDQAVAEDGIIYLEGRLYATSTADVVWGGMISSPNDGSLNKLADDFANAAIFSMAAKGLVR